MAGPGQQVKFGKVGWAAKCSCQVPGGGGGGGGGGGFTFIMTNNY